MPFQKIEFNNADDDYKTNVATIKRHMKGPTIVLVWAVWCPHCVSMKSDWESLKEAHGNTAHFVEIESTNLERIKQQNKALFKQLYVKPDRVFYPMIMMRKDNKGKLYEEERSFEVMKKHVDDFYKKPVRKTTKKPTKKLVKKVVKPDKQSGGSEEIPHLPHFTGEVKKFQQELNDYIRTILHNIK